MKSLSLAVVSVLVLGASALVPPAPPADSGCCCCDISNNRIDCDRSIPASECVCAQVVCPAGAPTFWHGTPPYTPPPTPQPTYKQCCCCNPSINAVVCSLKPEDDCFCAAVVCPTGAKTIFAKETPAPSAA